MARAIQYVIDLSKEEAATLLNDFFNPKPNAARDATLERARKLNVQLR